MPDDSFLRFENVEKRDRLTPLLHKVYQFESRRISGAHGGSKRFSECIWTKSEILNEIFC